MIEIECEVNGKVYKGTYEVRGDTLTVFMEGGGYASDKTLKHAASSAKLDQYRDDHARSLLRAMVNGKLAKDGKH